MSVFFITGCRVSAVTGACVGHLGDRRGRALSERDREAEQEATEDLAGDCAAGSWAYVSRAGIGDDKEGPLFWADEARRGRAGAMAPYPQDSLAAGEEVLRGGRDRPIAVRESWDWHPLTPQDGDQRRDQKWSNHARGAGVRRACGYQDDRGLFVRKEQDAEVAARRIHIRVTGRKGE